MDFDEFIRKPFVVRAVLITEQNIDEVAEYIGTLRTTKEGDRYIQVNRRLIPYLLEVYPGYWMTRMGDKIRCYTDDVFEDQFTEITPDIRQWVDFLAESEREPDPA